MRLTAIFVVVVCATSASPTVAQTITLSPDAIAAAIQVGTKNKGKQQGLDLQDSSQSFTAALAKAGEQGSTGFSVVLYTPTTWIRQQASDSAKRFQQMTPSDVGEPLLEPVLRVIANPDMPNTVTAAGMRGTSSVDHVVLQDKDRKITIQPVWKEAFDTEASNALGGKASFKGLNAKFPLEALREIHGPNGDKEFFVVVIGSSGEEKRFEVKKKHFERLP